jgi:hypothetical protein
MIKKIHLVLFFIVFLSQTTFAQRTFTISGYLREKGSQEQLIGVNVYVPNSPFGTSSNNYGFYSITLPANDAVTLVFSFVGYERIEKTFVLNKNIEMNIELATANQLNEVVVSSKRQEERVSESVEMSKIDIPIYQIKKIPSLMGEKDVLKVLQLMPGVQKGSEGQSGIYVRGGGPDQNLIILDDAVVYNAYHLFGFFSVFNGDALKSVELTKGGFPARYGGRVSSVIEMTMKEGNKEKLHGEGGIGLISSRMILEGPIKTKKQKATKSSFIISGRRTYLDLLAAPIIKASQKNADQKIYGGYFFYDLNAKVNYDFGRKDKLYLSSYFGKDNLSIKSINPVNTFLYAINWKNETATLRWNHLFSQKLFGNLSLIYSRYRFNTSIFIDNTNSTIISDYKSGIRDYTIKYDFDFFPAPKHSLKFGLQSTFHRFTPSAVFEKDQTNNVFENRIDNIDAVESGIYVEDIWQATSRIKMNAGLRLSNYQVSGASYVRPEPRLATAYKLTNNLAFKASYALMNQYVHLLTNTGIGLPTDLWVPSTDKLAPQQSQQVAAGFAKDFDKKSLTLTIEGYYKKMNNLINYKEGASFLQINDPTSNNQVNWEDNITTGQGWSYGAEFLIQKKVGKFSGWAGYTLSWTKWRFEELNFGKVFFPRYDRRNDISLVGIYDIKPNITVSAVWVFGTGNAFSLPISTYNSYSNFNTLLEENTTNKFNTPTSPLFTRQAVQDYGEKNTFRAEPYHRLDLGVRFSKKKRRHERTWEISIYNAYNRKNPFFYQISDKTDANNQTINILQRYSIFSLIPSFSYNFKF